MNRKYSYKIILFLLIWGSLATSAVTAQEAVSTAPMPTLEDAPFQQIYNFAFIARAYGDSVVLRWAPENAGLWLSANYYGWKLTRYKIEEEMGENDTIYEIQLGGKPIKPMPLEEMKQKYDTSFIYVGTAAQALYGQMPVQYEPSSGMENYIFRREQEQTQRQAMAYLAAEIDRNAADALGLRFVDRSVKPGITYTYTLECLVPREMVATPILVIDVPNAPFVRDYQNLVPEIQFYQNSPYTVLVYWKKNKLSGYFVERSSDKGKTWEKMNTAPLFGYDPDPETYEVLGNEIGKLLEDNVGMMDSLPLNQKFQYRVTAFDGFADYAPAQTSQLFELEDRIPPSVPVLDIILPEDNKICTLNWYVDFVDDDLEGYMVTFSNDPSGPWDNVTDILPPKTRQWVDKNAHDRGRGYYRIFAIDKSRNVSFSMSQINNIEDDMPPAPPTGLAAIIDTAGIMTMQWEANKEYDLLGYRVYFANQLDHEFVQITGRRLEDTIFIDTLSRNTLTKYVYFYVVSEDNSYNFSQPSDTIAVPIPDIVPPGVALLQNYTRTDVSVTFTWLRSVSKDVAYYYIYRKLEDEKQWKCIHVIKEEELPAGDSLIFTDYPEPSPRNYQYCIEVLDNGKLSSGKTGQTTVRFRGSNTIKVPLTLKAKLNKEKTAVKLDFTYEYESKSDYYGVIFKSTDGENFTPLNNFQRGETTYTDYNIYQGEKSSYYIQLFLGKGRRSQKSETIVIRN